MARPPKTPGEKFRSPQLAIRIPPGLKAELERQAQAAGKTLTEYLLPELQRIAARRDR